MSENVPPQTKKPLILKFEYDGQQYELASLTTADYVGDLRAVVCSMLNIDDFKRIQLKTLQPTKLIDTSDDMKPLADVFCQTRERIVVEEVLTPSSHSDQSDISSFRPTAKHLKTENAVDSDEQTINSSQKTNSTLFNPILSPSQNSADLQHDEQLASSDGNQSHARRIPGDQSEYPVCSSTGYLLRHPVPSNNSCLFISVHFCLTHGVVDDQIGKSMRKIIAETVASDRQHFDEAFLGKPNDEYCAWILDDNNWGGAIELSILCKYYDTEIVAIDVKNTILNRFGEDSHYPQRMLLLYDGLHYDPIKFQPLNDDHPVQTLFSSDNIEVLNLAVELAKEAKQSHQYTDLKTMTMRCATCNAALDTKTAREHAAQTGHVDFIE